jgi:regulator of PEP synthase PpsR (kinase-PPPase family)
MRDVKLILKNRDKLKEAVFKIQAKINEVRDDREWEVLTKEKRSTIGTLYGLKNHYEDQMKALNYVLNEDSKLNDFKWCSIFQEFKDYFVELD